MAEKRSRRPVAKRAHVLDPETEQKLRKFVQDTWGIVILAHQAEKFRNTVSRAVDEFSLASCDQFYQVVRQAPLSDPTVEFLITNVRVGETFFFRDKGQMDYLKDDWLPKLITAKRKSGSRTIKVWSAACSSGEEPYSLAIYLRQNLPDYHEWDVSIMGTDISFEAMGKASAGVYSPWSFRSVPVIIKNQNFDDIGPNRFQLKSGIRDMVTFNYLNLVEDGFPSRATHTSDIDLILCRNVFIYFDIKIVTQVMAKLSRCLAPEGVLLVGASDLTNFSIDGMALIQQKNMSYYKNATDVSSGEASRLSAKGSISRETVSVLARSANKQRLVSSTRVSSASSSALDKIKATMSAKQVAAPVRKTVSAGESANSCLVDGVTLQHISSLIDQERWPQSLATIETLSTTLGASALLCRYRAKTLAGLGRVEEAKAWSAESLTLDPLDPRTNFLNALLHSELAESDEAVKGLRRAVFLDQKFVEAHFHLGLLLLGRGERRGGLRSLKNALFLAQQGDGDELLGETAGMTMADMAETLEREISAYA